MKLKADGKYYKLLSFIMISNLQDFKHFHFITENMILNLIMR